MATHSVPIPLTTIPANTPTTIGPATTNHSLTSVSISVDRTIAGGLNSLSSSAIYTMETDLSFDSGSTWTKWSSITTTGGNVPDDQGNPEPTTIDSFAFNPPIPRKTSGRLIITCTAQVAVQGTATLTD